MKFPELTALFTTTTAIFGMASIVQADLVAHWKLDEASGPTAADSSGNGLDVTGGGTFGVTGVADTAVRAPRLLSDAADEPTLNLAGGSVTLSLWAQGESSGGFRGLAGIEGSAVATNDAYSLKLTDTDLINWTFVGASPLASPGTFNNYAADNGGWAHIVGTYDGTTGLAVLYVNGTEVATTTNTSGIPDRSVNFGIGRYNNTTSFAFDRAIDDVQLYNTALTATDIAILYSNPGFDLNSVPSSPVMGPPSADTLTDDGATVQCQLLNAGADEVIVVWALSDQGETDVGTWTGAPGGGSFSFGSASQNDVLSHAIQGLDGDTEYSFRYYASAAGDADWSDAGSFATGLGGEPAPVGLVATAGDSLIGTRVDLTWTDSYATESGFVIQRSTDAGFATSDEFSVGADVTGYTDNTTAPNTTYFYRIAAVGTTGAGSFTAGVEVTTGAAPPEVLVAHWKMDGGIVDDPGPASLIDSSGNGFDLVEDTRFTQGSYAAGVSDTGVRSPRYQGVESTSRDLALEAGSKVSLSAWIYLAGGGGANDLVGSQCIAGYPGTGSGVDQYGLTTANGGIIWNYNSNGSFVNVQANFTPVAEGGWYHVVGVYESGVGGKIHVNGPGLTGTLTASGGDVGALADNKVDAGARFAIGTYANSTGFTSSKVIDEVQLFNTALTDAEVAALYADPGGNPLAASITSFEGAGATGVIDHGAKTIALEVPFGSDLATLAPTFTLSSGTCDQPSGGVPSPSFAAQNPVDYVVTDTSTDPATVNTYSVTVTVGPEIATLVIDLGGNPGTTIAAGADAFIGSGPTNLPLPPLPFGSILRSVDMDVTLESTDNSNFSSDLALLFDPTPGTPGGDFSLGIMSAASNVDFGQTETLAWGSGGAENESLTDTVTRSAWSGDLDLSSTGIFLGNAYDSSPGTPGDGGTWAGTITLTYEVGSGVSPYTIWSGGGAFGADKNGDGISNGLAFLLGAADPDEDATGRLPVVAEGAGGLTLSFTCRDAASRGGAVLRIQWSHDLGATDPWNANFAAVPAPPGGTVNDIVFTVTENGADASLDDVVATIPSGKAAGGRLFGRLEGTEN